MRIRLRRKGASTSQPALMRKRISATALPTASAMPDGPASAERASWTVTAAINASEATFTPSSAARAPGDRRTRGSNGPLAATKMKAGRKIPMVATTAPAAPPSRYPMKVAVVKTGPGVAWPTATASSN